MSQTAPLRLVEGDRRPQRRQLTPGCGGLAHLLRAQRRDVPPLGVERAPVGLQALLHLRQPDPVSGGRGVRRDGDLELAPAPLHLVPESSRQIVIG